MNSGRGNFAIALFLIALFLISMILIALNPYSFCAENELADAASGNASIKAAAGDSEIVIKTTARLAGAIDSLIWRGREFIDSTDHGRQLQSASNFDAGSPVTNETSNPTEAGSRSDGAGPTSTSRLLRLVAKENRLESANQMAFWLAPGERSDGNFAKNATKLSNHLLTKRVTIGWRDLPGVISYEVVFTLPSDEKHRIGTFEALTGYMPGEFSEFWKFDPKERKLVPLDDGPGEQSDPVVLSVREKTHAMGVYAPPQTAIDMTGPTYGRFRFKPEKVVKWNCVFRIHGQQPLAPGGYPFRVFVCVGDLETVRLQLSKLHEVFDE